MIKDQICWEADASETKHTKKTQVLGGPGLRNQITTKEQFVWGGTDLEKMLNTNYSKYLQTLGPAPLPPQTPSQYVVYVFVVAFRGLDIPNEFLLGNIWFLKPGSPNT